MTAGDLNRVEDGVTDWVGRRVVTSHHDALALEPVRTEARVGLFRVELETHRSSFFELEEFLEQLLNVVVRLGRRLHETGLPGLGQRTALLRRHFARCLVALVADEHNGNAVGVAFDETDFGEDRLQLLQCLPVAEADQPLSGS